MRGQERGGERPRGEGETDRHRQTQTDTDTQTHTTHTHTHRDTHRHRHRHTRTDTDTDTHAHTVTDTRTDTHKQHKTWLQGEVKAFGDGLRIKDGAWSLVITVASTSGDQFVAPVDTKVPTTQRKTHCVHVCVSVCVSVCVCCLFFTWRYC